MDVGQPEGGVTGDPVEPAPDAANPARWWRRLGIGAGVVAVVLLVGFLGAGWYFSDQIAADALRVDDDPPEYDVQVVAVGDESITFALGDDPEDDLLSDEVLGVAGPAGYGQVTGAVQQADGTVTRAYTHIGGEAPAAGAGIDLQGYAYPDDPAVSHGIEFSDVRYSSPFGTFDAWFVPGTDDRWVIMVHGRGAHPREMLRMLPAVVAAGHPALVIFYRNDPGQPATDDHYARFGVTEWQDLEGAVRYALDAGADDVAIFGASMGGAIATSFMLRSELADRVAALILDSPALDLGAMVREEAGKTNLPALPIRVPNTLTAWSMWLAGARFDLDWGDLDYLDRADRLDVPILLFHGDEDGTVPVTIGDRLARERPDLVRYVRIDDADHVRGWNVDPDAYAAELGGFLAGLD